MRVAFLYNESSEDPAGLAEDGDPARSPIVHALRRAGHAVTPIACTLNLSAVRRELERVRPEVAFNRVESLGGSDALAAAMTLLLDVMQLPYTGCTTESLLATANKVAVKERLRASGLPTPAWIRGDCGFRIAECGLTSALFIPQSEIRNPKFILKSALEHASFAMDDDSVIAGSDRDEVVERIRDCESRWQRPYFAEEFIDGREFNLALLGDGPTVLPPAEIDFSAFPTGKPRIVGRGAKFDTGSFEYENTPRRYEFPPADYALIRRLGELATECWRQFGLRGYARVDFRVDRNHEPWILEINSNPCLGSDSGFAAAAAEAGIGYDALIERIVRDALERHQRGQIHPCEPTDEHALVRA
jgi:D-alanine-D-alanine ligase